MRPLKINNEADNLLLQISPTHNFPPVTARERTSLHLEGFHSFDDRKAVMKSVQEEHIAHLFSRSITQMTSSQQNIKFKPMKQERRIVNSHRPV